MTRVHHDELAARVLDLMAQHSAWQLSLGYEDGVHGAERVPSGAYLGDGDMFLFIVDGNRDLDDPKDWDRRSKRTVMCRAAVFTIGGRRCASHQAPGSCCAKRSRA
jgi:hypothetical protein